MRYVLFLIFPSIVFSMIIDFLKKIKIQLLYNAVLVSSVQKRDKQQVLAIYFTHNHVYMLAMIPAFTHTLYIEELCQWVEQEGKIVGNEFQIQAYGIKWKIHHWSSFKGDSMQHK